MLTRLGSLRQTVPGKPQGGSPRQGLIRTSSISRRTCWSVIKTCTAQKFNQAYKQATACGLSHWLRTQTEPRQPVSCTAWGSIAFVQEAEMWVAGAASCAMKAELLRAEVAPLCCCAPEAPWRLLILDAEVSKHASTAVSGKYTFILQQSTQFK